MLLQVIIRNYDTIEGPRDALCLLEFCQLFKGATTDGSGGPNPTKIWTDHPNFFDEESDYRYVTDCSARN